MELREIGMAEIEDIKRLIDAAFSAPPWNDDWADDEVFTHYTADIINAPGALSFGLYEDDRMVGLCLGRVKHWFNGGEYIIDDICIDPEEQGKGLGSRWMAMVEDALRAHGVDRIGLLTRRDAPAYGYYRKNDFTEVPEDVWLKKKL